MDELVKRLRNAARLADKGLVITPSVCLEAADAIEELIVKLNHADDQIDRLVEAAEKRRWIPVEERLPEPKRKVLISTEFGGVYYGFVNERKQFITANDQYHDSWCWEPNASHWMPLPEPPKEE